jgi:hypothetical protein
MRSTIMKKTIATAAISFGLSCALVLANSQDSSSIYSAPHSSATSPNERVGDFDASGNGLPDQSAGHSSFEAPGIAGPEGDIGSDPNAPSLPGRDRWAGASMCTDANGLSFRRGTRGFERCVESKRGESQKEAAGEAAPDRELEGAEGGKSRIGR